MLQIEIVEVSVTQMGFALMLKPPFAKKVVPIFIGPLETYSISNVLEGRNSERPMTHDLIKSSFSSIGVNIEKIIINDFQSGTFYARMVINKNSEFIEVDARPSDAIAMALRYSSPIYMAESVYDQTSIEISLIKEVEKRGDIGFAEEEASKEEQKEDLIKSVLKEFEFETEEIIYQDQLEVLQQMLKVAVKKENYEKAAELRDRIRVIQQK